jgi:hypothetical protein
VPRHSPLVRLPRLPQLLLQGSAVVERDGLTRLLTHTAFLERVRAALTRRRRRPDSPDAALAVLDLDHFKKSTTRGATPSGIASSPLCPLSCAPASGNPTRSGASAARSSARSSRI